MMIKRLLTLGTLISSIGILMTLESKAESIWIKTDLYRYDLDYFIDVNSVTRKGNLSFYNMCATGKAGNGEIWRLEDCDERKTGQRVNCKDRTRFNPGYNIAISGGRRQIEESSWMKLRGKETFNLVCN